MTYRPHGKHVRIDEDMPQALGICDYTGFVHNRVDLVRQMEYRGNALVWTGFYVGKSYADKPNEQLKPPILPPDPVPIREPRMQQPTQITWSGNYTSFWPNLNPPDSWANWSGSEDGIPALPQSQRLTLLQQGGNSGSPALNPGATPFVSLTPQQRLQSLQSYYWSPTK
jgi:hypothetical protein